MSKGEFELAGFAGASKGRQGSPANMACAGCYPNHFVSINNPEAVQGSSFIYLFI